MNNEQKRLMKQLGICPSHDLVGTGLVYTESDLIKFANVYARLKAREMMRKVGYVDFENEDAVINSLGIGGNDD